MTNRFVRNIFLNRIPIILLHHVVPDTLVWYYMLHKHSACFSFTNRTYLKETVPGSIQRVSEFGTREAVDPVREQILQTGNVNVNRFNRLIENIRIRSAINLRIGGHGSSQRANHR